MSWHADTETTAVPERARPSARARRARGPQRRDAGGGGGDEEVAPHARADQGALRLRRRRGSPHAGGVSRGGGGRADRRTGGEGRDPVSAARGEAANQVAAVSGAPASSPAGAQASSMRRP